MSGSAPLRSFARCAAVCGSTRALKNRASASLASSSSLLVPAACRASTAFGPHVGERRQAEKVQVFGRRGPDLVGIGLGSLCNPDRRLLELSKRALQRSKVFRERRVALAFAYEIANLAKKRFHRASAILGELSPDKIERLDAVRAFIDHRNPRIADELLHPPFADVAVTAEHLLGFDGVG